MNLLLSGLDTVECAYYLRCGCITKAFLKEVRELKDLDEVFK